MCTYLPKICREHSTICFIRGFVIQLISEKSQCSKDFTSNVRDILYGVIHMIIVIKRVMYMWNYEIQYSK